MSTSVLKALPGKLDIKRQSPSILYVSSQGNDQIKRQVVMTVKSHNHIPQTNKYHYEEETQQTDGHKIARIQLNKAIISLFLSKMVAN